ncbi:Chromosomal replication initiator protein DnaA [Candidatus Entotheonellaceae bacterium PAL068K]
MDALLVDDVRFFAGKDRTQEEFFYTFDVLYLTGKRVIVAGDRPPHETVPMQERLRSRHRGIADIQPLDLETRVVILHRKAEEQRLSLPQQIAILIASRLRTNSREPEKCLMPGATRLYTRRALMPPGSRGGAATHARRARPDRGGTTDWAGSGQSLRTSLVTIRHKLCYTISTDWAGSGQSLRTSLVTIRHKLWCDLKAA